MTAAAQLNRIVQLIAEGSRKPDGAETPIREFAARFGVTERQIQEDLRVLTLLGEDVDAEWLLSLEVWQEQDRVRVASRGPWRRPLRLTPDELVALSIAVASEPGGERLAARLGELGSSAAESTGLDIPDIDTRILATVRDAVRDNARLELLYAGEGKRAAKARTVHPHQLFVYGGRWYCVAWCETAAGWRHFRLDRTIDALAAGGRFAPRDDHEVVEAPDQVFQADRDALDRVRVRFRPGIARWIKEAYADHEAIEGGGVDVVFPTGSPHWLARHVLQYGAEAEVIEPRAYREAVRRVVA